MKKVITISSVILILMYSISLFPVIEINKRIKGEEHKLKNAKSIDLSGLTVNGENFLENRKNYYFGSISATLNIRKQGECGNEDYFERYPGSGLDRVSIGNTTFNSIECMMKYLGDDYITGISFKGIENNNAYVDKKNNIMILIRTDYSPYSQSNWIIIKDIEIYQFYRKPIFYLGPLALFDPLRVHFVATFYPIIDRIILPLYYMFLIFPFMVKIIDNNLGKKKIFKLWIILNIVIVTIAVIFFILEYLLMSMQ